MYYWLGRRNFREVTAVPKFESDMNLRLYLIFDVRGKVCWKWICYGESKTTFDRGCRLQSNIERKSCKKTVKLLAIARSGE